MEDPTPEDKLAPKFDDTTPDAAPSVSASPVISKQDSKWKRFWQAYWRKKFLTLPLTLLLLIAVLMVVPMTRYSLLGTFLKREYKVTVLDAGSGKPVSNAVVHINDVSAKTDAQGNIKVRTQYGQTDLITTKKYYSSVTSPVVVGLSESKNSSVVKLKATGRQVPVVVTNRLNGKPLAGALLTAAGTEAKTTADGKAVIVLPAVKTSAAVTISQKGFNDLKATIKITEQADKANSFALTTSGKLYFLSRQSGKVDVVKTNLDGSDRQVVLAGTGSEDQTDTIMLASRDWKYLALKSKREGGSNAKLFMIDTATDKVRTFDEGDATFSLTGWSDHKFVYTVYRNGVQNWQPKAQAIKSYDPTTSKLATIDESDAEGTGQYDYKFNSFGSIYILGDELVYYKNWSAYYYGGGLNGKSISLMSARADGSNKHSIKDFPISGNFSYYSLNTRLYEPAGVYVQVPAQDNNSKPTYFEYEDGKLEAKPDVTDQQFNDPYPTFLLSPSAKQTFWSEQRDGANTLFVGDPEGKNSKQVAQLSEYDSYGWYGDDYLLVSKDASQLFIMSVDGKVVTKISDYHKPNYDFRGYGGGYGGL